MNNFSERHNGIVKEDLKKMLTDIGVQSLDELIEQTIPSSIRLENELDLPKALSESRFLEHMYSLAKKNKNYRSCIGMGYFNTILPPVIQRNILELEASDLFKLDYNEINKMVKGYPSMIIINKGKFIKEYNGDRSYLDIIKFINFKLHKKNKQKTKNKIKKNKNKTIKKKY